MDWYFLAGRPYLVRLATGVHRPQRAVLGTDFAGTVESVGRSVQEFRAGDEVFGAGKGACAEYICVPEGRVALKPANLTFEQAAAVPVAALTALQSLRDRGQIRPRQRVLINGASGGVGTFAVQIAKSFGAEVTGVCSTRNVDLVRSLGADRVIDYTKEDFTRGARRYELMLDIAGSRAWSECKRVLDPKAIYVLVGGPKANRWIGPLGHFVAVRLASMGDSRKVILFASTMNKQDLLLLQGLLAAGRVTPVIDRRCGLSEIPESFRYLGGGHAKGKIVIRCEEWTTARLTAWSLAVTDPG